MNAQNLALAAKIISPNYVDLSSNALNSRANLIKVLLSQRCLPLQGWDDLSIEHFLEELAMMDTNNFEGKIGVGEREGRVFSGLVAKRHYYMSHGIGRSGDIRAEQPKAAGSSLMLKLTEYLVRDVLSICGYQKLKEVMIVPLATGMSISLVLSALKSSINSSENKVSNTNEDTTITSPGKQKKYVLWPRIDQKTCLKCIYTSGLEAIVVENILVGEALKTDCNAIESILAAQNDEILCVLSTTSCFAPRVSDDIEKIAELCKKYNVFHVINNAYGLQCSKIANSVNQAHKKGTVSCLISSTDKNLLVPVGGSLIYSRDKKIIDTITQIYPGRASAGPIIDVFITLLSMGKSTFVDLLQTRKSNLQYLRDQLKVIATKYSERVIETEGNTISTGITLTNFAEMFKSANSSITQLGSILYIKRVMGSRIICAAKPKVICGQKFSNYGSSSENYPLLPYMTVACAIGMKKDEIDCFIQKLEEVFSHLVQKNKQKQTINQEINEISNPKDNKTMPQEQENKMKEE